MTGSIIVINVDIRETRVALIEDGVIAELLIERAAHRSTVGDVVLGKVTRVLPGMQAAFIDVGHERSAFLHVEDLIRPDDFDRYLAEGGGQAQAIGSGASESQPPAGDGPAQEDADESESATAMRRATRRRRRRRDGPLDDSEVLADSPEGASDPTDTSAPSPAARQRRRRSRRGPGTAADAGTQGELASPPAPDEEEAFSAEGGEGGSVAIAQAAPALEASGLLVGEPVAAVPAAATDDHYAPDELEEERELGAQDLAAAAGYEFEEELGEEPEPSGSDSEPGEEPDADLGGPIVGSGSEPLPADERIDFAADAYDGIHLQGDPAQSSAGAPDAPLPPVEGGATGDAVNGVDSAATARRSRGGNARRAGSAREASGRGGAARAGRDANAGRRGRARGSKEKSRPGLRTRLAESSTPSRVSRSVPITEVVKEGDLVVVQISKEPIGTKGARVTSHVSLPGRYVVYLPTVDHLGVSKRIGHSRERSRLRKAMESLKPARGGLIVRTVAEGLTKKQLKADIGYLIRVWSEICRKREQAKPAAELYTELDLILKVARDLFTDDVQRIVIDDREQYGRLCRFVEMFLPERVKDIELYTGDDLIFDAYGIEDEIARSLGRKVPLPSGGSLIVDQAEALTAIDVNTGRYVGKGSKDLEETALKTNLEAVEEIAYQLRFRNIGGLVILDLIDMDRAANREKVWRALESALVKDKAKTTLNRISDLGLVEMTRKRTRDSLGRTLHEPCFYCDGTGHVQSKQTIAYEIMRQIGRERQGLPGYSVVVNAHPAVVDLLRVEEPGALAEAERRYTRRIELVPRAEYHLEQYDIHGK